jgi:hypothetical protein
VWEKFRAMREGADIATKRLWPKAKARKPARKKAAPAKRKAARGKRR